MFSFFYCGNVKFAILTILKFIFEIFSVAVDIILVSDVQHAYWLDIYITMK